MPEGWHVEGQVLPLAHVGYRAFATKPTAPDKNRLIVEAVGYTPALALANLPRRVRLVYP